MGVRINAVLSGLHRYPDVGLRLQRRADHTKAQPIGSSEKREEVAAAVMWLCATWRSNRNRGGSRWVPAQSSDPGLRHRREINESRKAVLEHGDGSRFTVPLSMATIQLDRLRNQLIRLRAKGGYYARMMERNKLDPEKLSGFDEFKDRRRYSTRQPGRRS